MAERCTRTENFSIFNKISEAVHRIRLPVRFLGKGRCSCNKQYCSQYEYINDLLHKRNYLRSQKLQNPILVMTPSSL